MRDTFYRKRGLLAFAFFALMALTLIAGRAWAIDLQLFDNPLTLKGYVNQSVQFGVAGDHYDTMQGFQQGLMQALVEIGYRTSRDLRFFVSGQFTKDWAYDILDGDDDWEFRRFDESRDEMSLRDDYEDVLKECHVSWYPGDFNIRVGKQIVSWGRMDAFRIMDQINPEDRRLGPSDVEFETTIIPVWLAKLEYWPTSYIPPFLDELGIEFIFNPNADFIPSKKPSTGNDVYGIWSASSTVAPNALFPNGARPMSFDENLEEPDKWNSEGYEYGFRIRGTFPDATFFTLNFFDGVNNDAVKRTRYGEGQYGLGLVFDDYLDDEGRQIIHPLMEGYYADQTFVGFTFAREMTEIYSKALGGVSPLIRGELTYEFDSTFATKGLVVPYSDPWPSKERWEEHDVLYWGLGVEWKIKWNLLNPRRMISLTTQFGHKHIKDYPDTDSETGRAYTLTGPLGTDVSENQYNIYALLRSQYLHDKLTPTIVYVRDIKSDVTHSTSGSIKGDTWIFRLQYEPNHIWTFKTQLTLMENDGNDPVDNYDNLSFTVQYQF